MPQLPPHSHYDTLYKDIFYTAFQKAANAFSLFTGVSVKFEWMNFKNVTNHLSLDSNAQNYFVLLSELKEDIKGKCYLTFSEKDANCLFKLCLQGNQSTSKAMQEALLLELDNILTASVVSVLSDKLNLHAYAYVPKLIISKPENFYQMLATDEQNHHLVFKIKAVFTVHNHDINTDFYWLFNTVSSLNEE